MRSERRVWAQVLVVATAALASSCTQTNEGSNPAFPNGGLLLQATPASAAALAALEAIFSPTEGTDILTADVVAKASPGTLSLLFGTDASYAIVHAGCLDGGERFVLEGYWRRALGADRGLLRLFVEPASAARALCNDAAPDVRGAGLAIAGLSSEGDDVPHTPFAMTYSRPLRPWRGSFAAIGHRAGCFPQYDCGASGNTLETIRLAQGLGSDAIEIDVRSTRDGVPILYHDPSFASYLSKGRFCTGSVADNTFLEIRANCRMAKGEFIPTLEEALEVTYRETTLQAVYLDTKVADVVPQEAIIAQRFNDRAKAEGRPFVVWIGIPDEAVKDAFVASSRPGAPCLLEYSPAAVRELGCRVWSPTWTEGPQVEEVQKMQAEGRAVFFWTLDGVEFIDTFLKEAKPNGIVSDRPALVFYRYQMVGTEPAKPELGP